MSKQIMFVGHDFGIRAEDVSHSRYQAQETLLDGDIIVFSIDISDYWAPDRYQGLRCLDDNSSFRLKADTARWRAEMKSSLQHGKTLIVFITNAAPVYVATGTHEHSGTGRNTRTTRHVEILDPYSVFPFKLGSVVQSSGEKIRKARDLGVLASYWEVFGESSYFEGYIDNFVGSKYLMTQTGEKAVGGTIPLTDALGSVVILPLPNLVWLEERRIESASGKGAFGGSESEQERIKKSVAQEFIAAIKAVDAAGRALSDRTPPPNWLQSSMFILESAEKIRADVSATHEAIRTLEVKADELKHDLAGELELQSLLFEKGKPLERAILKALRIIGFKAEGLEKNDSEFDAVLVDSQQRRYIGEAEGKDDRAISVEKLDQLDRNIREDFALQDEESAAYAHGILFGNAYRLSEPTRVRTTSQLNVTLRLAAQISV